MRQQPQRHVVAKEIRAVLARVFPDTTFSVRQHIAARSHQFVVSWTGGPSEDDVKHEVGSLPSSVPFGSLSCVRCSPSDWEPPR